MANDDLGDVPLSNLFERNQYLKGQIEGASKAARARGGTGANKDDKLAADFASEQVAIEGEIFGRLSNVHQSRSETAQIADESKRAEIADSPMEWLDDPNSLDWPGLDTPR